MEGRPRHFGGAIWAKHVRCGFPDESRLIPEIVVSQRLPAREADGRVSHTRLEMDDRS